VIHNASRFFLAPFPLMPHYCNQVVDNAWVIQPPVRQGYYSHCASVQRGKTGESFFHMKEGVPGGTSHRRYPLKA
jgi:hypothetical protein